MKYRIYYRYVNNLTDVHTEVETVESSTALNALKIAQSEKHLKQVMFKNGSEGTAKAYELYDNGQEEEFLSAALHCAYSLDGKWTTKYFSYSPW